MTVSDNATLTVGAGVTIHGVNCFIGSTASGRILNQGTIAADGGGTLTVRGMNNFASGTLTGGAWQVSGNSTLRLIGAAIYKSAADILVDGADARFFSDAGSADALVRFAVNAAGGRLRLQNGATLTTSAGNLNNQGQSDCRVRQQVNDERRLSERRRYDRGRLAGLAHFDRRSGSHAGGLRDRYREPRQQRPASAR